MAPVAHAHGMVMSEYGIGSRDAAPQAQFMLQEPVRDASGKQGLRGTIRLIGSLFSKKILAGENAFGRGNGWPV